MLAVARYVPFLAPMEYDQAVADKVKVICNWYNKHKGGTFTYDGPRDATEYSLENALGLLEFEPCTKSSNRLQLRDPSQTARLNELLKLTMPSETKGSKRTRGEEKMAADAKVKRERSCPEDEGFEFRAMERAKGKRHATKAM